ncbi:UBX domain-containing protein 11 [Varanus komodoensis]|uniref:UBX domain-containing protein 11 n=1 Tax=Varanus komodoensis TaxID=61221 RepID=UPI001CF7B05F|nr:UBX domain-containing protein 11 [Varanus komodoensis]
MTSPLSSLGKIRKMPLQLESEGKRAVPFKENFQTEDENAMIDEILGPGAQIPVQVNVPSCSDGVTANPAALGPAPTDMELMASMMQKIASLEHMVKTQAQAIHQKNRKIKEFEKQIKILQKAKETSGLSRAKELEVICLQLQHQIWEMEEFLNDYGLIWVGKGTYSLEEVEAPKQEENAPSQTLWKPGDAIISEPSINFDLIFENLKDLNALAGEGMSKIEHTSGGARLRQMDSVPLTFYRNGIVMFNGPFRSYEEPSTQQCLRDLMDGYFPSELQRYFPDGVPFQVTDKRDVLFQERQLPAVFSGKGHIIGHSEPSGGKETNVIPGPKLTAEQFLSKLPPSLIRDGHVIDVREEVKQTLQGSSGAPSHEVVLVETPSLVAMRNRLGQEKKKDPSEPSVATLRIKSENGEKTYIIKMLFSETVGDLRQHLAQSRGREVEPYEILSTFPIRVYNDDSMTLEECGLVPNASLLLRKKGPLAKSQGTDCIGSQ